MRSFIVANFAHVLCGLLLISRLGDVLSTRLVTPTMALEANPIMRRLGWPFAWATLLICLLPYWNTALALVALVPSLLVSSANLSKLWLVRALGEREYAELLRRAVTRSRLSHALMATAASSCFLLLTAAVLWFLSPDPERDWGYWFALGMALYGAVVWLYGSLALRRLFRRERSLDA